MIAAALPLVGAFKSVPRFVWYALAAALVFAFAVHWFNGRIEAAEKRGAERAYANVERQARELERKANALNARIVTAIKEKNRVENARIAADADALRLRGPGAARCASAASLPSGPGGRVAAGGRSDAAGSGVPVQDSAAVPWGWLVNRAEQADLNRAEVLAWREWHARFTAEWAKWKAEAERAVAD